MPFSKSTSFSANGTSFTIMQLSIHVVLWWKAQEFRQKICCIYQMFSQKPFRKLPTECERVTCQIDCRTGNTKSLNRISSERRRFKMLWLNSNQMSYNWFSDRNLCYDLMLHNNRFANWFNASLNNSKG